MQKFAETLPGGTEYTPGICIFCHQPFDEKSSGGYFYGHKLCVEKSDAEWKKKWAEELIAKCPPGTRFDLAGGAACD